MNARTRLIAIALAAAAGAGGPGCSNLVVKKVPIDKRIQGTDHQQGFRYYLNRPYLVVKDPVLIFERLTLVEVTGKHGDGSFPVAKFLEGERKGQTIRLADLNVKAGDQAFRPVAAAELSRIRAELASKVKAASATPARSKPGALTPPTERDSQVVRTAISSGAVSAATVGALPSPLTATAALAQQGAPASTGGRTASSVDQNASSTASLKDESIGTAPTDTVLTGAIQVIYLPDLDEQYVIKSKNWLAKSSFALAFRNGSELTEVDAEHDATTVTIALLDLLQQAIVTAVAGRADPHSAGRQETERPEGDDARGRQHRSSAS